MKKLLIILFAAPVMAQSDFYLPHDSACGFEWDRNPVNEEVTGYILEWTGPDGASGNGLATETSISCVEVGVDNQIKGQHKATVKAYNDYGTSDPSNEITFEFGSIPTPPTNVKVSIMITISTQ